MEQIRQDQQNSVNKLDIVFIGSFLTHFPNRNLYLNFEQVVIYLVSLILKVFAWVPKSSQDVYKEIDLSFNLFDFDFAKLITDLSLKVSSFFIFCMVFFWMKILYYHFDNLVHKA